MSMTNSLRRLGRTKTQSLLESREDALMRPDEGLGRTKVNSGIAQSLALLRRNSLSGQMRARLKAKAK